MGYLESLKIIGEEFGYSIGLLNDMDYKPESTDNVIAYNKFYPDKADYDSYYSSQHGVLLLRDGKIIKSACICSAGGATAIHPKCSILEVHRLLLCCGSNIFCLSIPALDLLWITEADSATCFEIYEFEDSYIVHGELQLSRIGQDGKTLWCFSGSDIFTTPTGREDFKLEDGVIQAKNWDNHLFRLDARTGKELK